MYAVFVTIDVQPGFGDRFTEASLADARGSVNNERGCFRFDVLGDPSDSNRFYLYEVYEDQAAMDAHVQTPHFKTWRETTKDWIAGEFDVTVCETVFPSAEGWRKQKPYLPD